MKETSDFDALLSQKNQLLENLKTCLKHRDTIVGHYRRLRDLGRSPSELAPHLLPEAEGAIKDVLNEVFDLGLIDDPIFQPFVQEFGRPITKAERDEKKRQDEAILHEFLDMLTDGPEHPSPEQAACIEEIKVLTKNRDALRREIERDVADSRPEHELAAALRMTSKRLLAAIPRAKELKLHNNPLVKALAKEYP